jgi:hypothetical protein
MRITLTINDDVATDLQSEMRRQKSRVFKDTVNDVLRRGLLVRRELAASRPFKVQSRHMGTRQGLNYDNVSELLDSLESTEHD